MQYQRLWQWGAVGIVLTTIGVIEWRTPPAAVQAEPRTQLDLKQSVATSQRVFSDDSVARLSSEVSAAGLSEPEPDPIGITEQVGATTSTSEISASHSARSSSTTLENSDKHPRPETAITRSTRASMTNGSVQMTLDADGTLHLSGGSFVAAVGGDSGSWIAKTLTASGLNPNSVTKLVIDGAITVKNQSDYRYLFAGLRNLTQIEGLANLNLKGVTNLAYLFKDDQKLTTIDFGQLDFSTVTSFEGMFFSCSALTTIVGIEQWQTPGLTNASRMFAADTQLKTLDLNQWQTSRLNNVQGMFSNCSQLTSLQIGKWQTKSLTSLIDTFNGASSLIDLPIGEWDTSNVTNMLRTFAGCASLTSLDVAKWDTRNVVSMEATFMRMPKLVYLPVDNWQTSRVDNMAMTFYEDETLPHLPVANWDTSNVTTLKGTFAYMQAIKSLPIDKWQVGKVQTMLQTFQNDASLTSLPIGDWDVSNVATLNSAFRACRSLAALPVSKWKTLRMQDLALTFTEMDRLTDLPIDDWDTSNVTTLSGTFNRALSLTNIPVRKWDTSHVTDMQATFFGNPQLVSLPIENWNTSSVTSLSQLFMGCSGLKSLNLGTWDTTNVNNFGFAFNGTKLDKLDLTGWNTSNAQNYYNVFSGGQAPKRLLLGKNFNFFNSQLWGLPDPSHQSPYIGKWRSLNNDKIYTSTELMTTYDGNKIVGEFEWATGPTITVRYVDEDGNVLAPETQVTGAIGEDYHLKPIPIKGYVPEQPDGIQGKFKDQDETVTFKYSAGKVAFTSVPKNIDFGRNPITGESERYAAKYSDGLVVTDSRESGASWSLTASLAAEGFRGDQTGQLLAATLSYQPTATNQEISLQPGASVMIVENHQTTSNQGVSVLGSATPLGHLYLQVPTDQVLTDVYQAAVTWTLGQTVANL
ncbi:BspA family leucine-rich repeat surface protein [Lactiplantibacillus pentosus]|nr:BspA family leucine-rich repeat surface protein [Lactiplantibacillus pentosus]MBU7495862.1 BspA family leucine-rich repeat surface protein [Lactiplantibacillus pentosus]TDG89192.1 hypothetical protein C5L29_002670 [Lactiplantibacillus pentosus]USR88471.1 BspA family leucine-rich repeat surface protein [Lactiplantibacillus pentosus]UZO88073.1 BspA family leucine-rich repeat surface protein [Lactiplantibacillus pentosus]WKF75471.1 BspA family leucine-rich repeat surface protein [Lactiplantiba